MCVSLGVCMYTMCLKEPLEVRRVVTSLETGVTADCEAPCGYWELNFCSERATSAFNC